MLVTKKINIFSFFFRKPLAANNVKARSVSKAQSLDDRIWTNLIKGSASQTAKTFTKFTP